MVIRIKPHVFGREIGGPEASRGRSFFEQFAEPERGRVFAEVVELLRPSLCDADGVWTADHIRLRFAAERVS